MTAKEILLNELQLIRDYTKIGSKNTLTLDEAALYCTLSKDYLYRQTSNKTIPHFKKGRMLYFNKGELDSWLQSERVRTESELKSDAALYVATHK